MPCDRTSRRGFLQQGACGMFTIAALGLPGSVSALPVTEIQAQASGGERRYPLPTVDGVSIDRQAQVIIVRHAGKVYAMSLVCPHENAAVRWLPRDGRFQCSKHTSRYTPEGTFTSGRATRHMDRFPVRRDGAQVVVSVDRVFQSDRNLEGWTAAAVVV